MENNLSETQAALQRETDDLDAEKTSVRRNLAVLTAAGGALGALGAALDDGDEAAVRRAVAVVAADLARQPEIVQVEVPDTRAVKALEAQLADASVMQETLQIQVDDFSAQAIAMVSRIGLVTAAGDLLSDLGTALASGDETAVLASVNAIEARLAASGAAQSSKTSQTKG